MSHPDRVLPRSLPDAAADRGRRCLNCDEPAPGKYCAACGQETEIRVPTVRQLVHEFIDQFIALENTLGRTLRTLVTQPGELTLEYLRGRRQRYVRPFKLYLSISVVFFSLVGFMPEIGKHTDKDGDKGGSDAVQVDQDKDLQPQPDDSTVKKHAKSLARKLQDADKRESAQRKLADDAPYAMFFLMPYFALLLRWFYRGSGRLYGEHLLFSVHLHCFGFLALTLGFLHWKPLSDALNWAIAIYTCLALRHFYGGSWPRTLWRAMWLYFLYFVAVAATAVSGVFAIVLGE